MMLNRSISRKRTRTAKPKPSSVDTSHQVLKVLQQTLNVQQEQEGTLMANRVDIPWPMVQRDKTYTFVRTYQLSPISATNNLDTTFSYSFTLSAFPDATDFTALFDQYRIGPTRVTFQPQGAAYAVVNSVVGTAIDYDDANTLGISALGEYATYQQNSLQKTFWRTFQPRAANAAYSGTFTSFSQMPPETWIDVASPSVQYYGLKGQIPASAISGGPFIVYSVTVSSVLQFRNSR